MESFHKFIEINMVPLIFAYGLAYFAAGLAIILQQRRMSNFRLAHNLWLLGMFGIIHGAAEWGDIFIPIQGEYLSASWINLLVEVQEIAWAVSFAFLLQFAVSMIIPKLPWVPGVQNFLRWYAPLWSIGVTVVGIFFLPHDIDGSWIRYMLGFPAAALTAVAFLSERRSFTRYRPGVARINLTMTAIAFGLYAVLSGLIVPERGLSILSMVNYENVHAFSGFPIQFWRMLVGIAIAFFVIRTLSVFDLEVRQRLEIAEREQTLLQDRQRIARDLHDGVVQSIYAAGLQLEVVSSTARFDMDEASVIIRRVVNQLNDVIADIRKYIFKLGPARTGEADFDQYMQNLVEEFTANFGIQAHISLDGKPAALTPGQRQNIAFVARECLTNAYKHGTASTVEIQLIFNSKSLFFVAEDDGVGIDEHRIASGNQAGGTGLKSMAARAASLGGDFSISQRSESGGTMVAMRIPYRQTGEKP